MDVYWTFDYGEYNIRPGNTFTFDDVIERVNGFLGSPSVQPVESGKAPEGAVSKNIILNSTLYNCNRYSNAYTTIPVLEILQFLKPLI